MESDVPHAVARAATLLEKQPTSWTHAQRGYTPAERWVVCFSDGSSCFAKAATNDLTAEWLRLEYDLVYSKLQAPFLPAVLGWSDDALPLLVLEDLSAAHWPPPWSRDAVEAVLHTLATVRATALGGLPSHAAIAEASDERWLGVAADPKPFLSLGLCSKAWLQASLPRLLEYEATGLKLANQGEDLLHQDVRSDNLCFVDGRAVLVDWNFACRGNGQFDVAFWLPSLHSEGGPLPEEVLPDAPHWAALVSGFFASRAGLPPIPDAPRVREVQLSQLRSALPWAQRALGLAPLDGPRV